MRASSRPPVTSSPRLAPTCRQSPPQSYNLNPAPPQHPSSPLVSSRNILAHILLISPFPSLPRSLALIVCQAMVWRTNFDQLSMRNNTATLLAEPLPQPTHTHAAAAAASPPAAPPVHPVSIDHVPPEPRLVTIAVATTDPSNSVATPIPAPRAGFSAVENGCGSGALSHDAVLAGTLEQVVGQLDILAQTVALLEQRTCYARHPALRDADARAGHSTNCQAAVTCPSHPLAASRGQSPHVA